MSFIPFVKYIYPDELLYSWIHRLAKANGLLIKDFSNAYLGTNDIKIGALQYDVRKEFLPLYNNLRQKTNIISFYLSTSITGYESLFMTKGQQTKLVQNTFESKSALNTKSTGLISEIQMCPECLKEDKTIFGEPYIHRKHQILGIKICPVHHCNLIRYKGKRGHVCDYDLSDFEDIIVNKSVASENTFADYSSELFDYMSDLVEQGCSCDIKAVKDILYHKLKDNGYSVKDAYMGVLEGIKAWDYNDLIDYDIVPFLKVNMISADYIPSDKLLSLLMFLYPDIKELLKEIDEKKDGPLLKEYECPECNNTYITTPYAYNNHFGCPICNKNKSEEDILQGIFNNSGYDLVDKFSSMSNKVSLYHRNCRQTISIKPRSFVYEGVRCLCENIITEEKAKTEIDKIGGFELLEFNGGENSCTIKALFCGHIFTVRYRKFIKSPQCRTCYPKNMTTEALAERIKRLDSNYELVGDFVDQDTKIKILHHKCGIVSEYGPRYFHMGARCPHCNSAYAEKWNHMYQLLCDYKNEFGKVNIPKRTVYKNEKLGYWVQRQRRRSNIPKYQKQLLEDIGFKF